MMAKLLVPIKRVEDLSYEIIITYKEGFRDFFTVLVEKFGKGSRFAVVSDENVWGIYGKAFVEASREVGVEVFEIVIPAGEKSKSRSMKEYIEDRMLEERFQRNDMIIAFGGGVVGDIAGFVASTYLRGIRYIQLPTTLLAMVDSSIGGKVAIDTPYGKNTIGAFHQPSLVYSNINLLKTLPKEEILNGLAEVIKHAIIKDKEYFSYIEKNVHEILSLQEEVLVKVVERSCEIKRDVVVADEKETGYRRILNFGHTVGHALEAYTNYSIKHGFAVALGMLSELKISKKLGILKNESLIDKTKYLLEKLGYPLNPKKLIGTDDIDLERLVRFTLSDKKNVGIGKEEKAGVVLIEDIGEVFPANGKYVEFIPLEIIFSSLSET